MTIIPLIWTLNLSRPASHEEPSSGNITGAEVVD